SYLLRTLPYRQSLRHKLWMLVQAVQLFAGYIRLQIGLRFNRSAGPIDSKSCNVVLLTHNRPQNMWLLAAGALRDRFGTGVIVSNSNPGVKMREWITTTGCRLVLIDVAVPTQPGLRLVLARESGSEYVLSIDDDLFLTPVEWKNFFEFLVS